MACCVKAQVRGGLGVGQVGSGQVGAAAQEFGQGGGEVLQRQLAGFAAGHGLGFGVCVDHRVDHGLRKVLRQFACHAALQLFGQLGVRGFVSGEGLVPRSFLGFAFGFGVPIGIDLSGHFEGSVVPADGRACERNFVRTQGFAVGFGGVRTVGAALADAGFAHDQRGLVTAQLGAGDGLAHHRCIVAVDRANHVPAVCLEAFGCVVCKPWGHLAVDGNAVVVVQSNEFVQLPSACERAGFMADAFHQTTVAHENEGVVVDDRVAVTVEFRSQ